MKKFLIKFLVFCCVSILIYPLAIGGLGSFWLTQRRLTKNIIFNQGGNSFLWSKFHEADTTKNIDILILGSSLALRGIDTRVFEQYGYKTFNLASNYQTPLQTEFFLNKYLDQFSPKFVIWEVTPITFQNRGLESFIDVYSNSKIDLETFKQCSKISEIIALNTIIVSISRQVFGDFFNYKERTVKGTNRYVSGGFVETNNLDFDDREKSSHSYTIQFLNDQKLILENSLFRMKEEGIKIVLIQTPTTNEYFRYIKNWNEINEYFNSLVQRGLVDNYKNYNVLLPEFGKETFYFSDKMHLNGFGANEYTDLLYKDLSMDFLKLK